MPRVQTLSLRTNTPLVIECPEGLIRIGRGSKRNSIRIELPGEMVAHVGEERAMSNGRFVRQNDAGNLEPKYVVLQPVVDDEGILVGIKDGCIARVDMAPSAQKSQQVLRLVQAG